MRKKNILVLGAGGFIGRHLVSTLLLQGMNVSAAGHHLEELSNDDSLHLYKGEICTHLYSQIQQPEVIYFLLGGASVARSVENPKEDFDLTFPPLVELLNILSSRWTSSRLVFVSSAAVYGEYASISTSIDDKLSPVSPYGLHKKLAEDYINYYSKHNGIIANIVRPFSVYGPGLRKQLIWDVLKKIDRDEHHYFGTGEEKRDMIYINDLSNFLSSFISDNVSYPKIINAGTGKAISVKSIIKKIYALRNCMELPYFNCGDKQGDPQHLVCNQNEQILTRQFMTTSIDSGLQSVVSWYEKEIGGFDV